MNVLATITLASFSALGLTVLAEDTGGVCGLTVTCLQNATTTRTCTSAEDADYKLVSGSLQICDDVSSFFTKGQSWPINNKGLYCRSDSVCGKLVPYIRNTPYLADPCEKFVQYADVIATFRDYCRGESVQEVVGDGGLLLELKANNGTTKPTPAPTNPNWNSEPVATKIPANVGTSSAVSIAASVPLGCLLMAVITSLI